MHREPEYLDDCEPALLYIAKRLKDALRLEQLLTEAGVDYVVEPDKYVGGVLFRSERIGAFFYVRPEAGEAALHVLEANGYKAYTED